MECRVVFANLSLKQAFDELKEIDSRLYKEIQKALNDISRNCFCGRHVRKKLIPRDLIQKFEIKNIWIYNLRKDWRLLYSVANDEAEVLSIVLDWMNHKDYERLFNF